MKTRQQDTGSDQPLIDENAVSGSLSDKEFDKGKLKEVLAKALDLQGLDSDDIAFLFTLNDPEHLEKLFSTARQVKEEIYGSRLVIFAPLYVSNLCTNECLYCAFRAGNDKITRRALTQDEIVEETRSLIEEGHKRILLVAGESYPNNDFRYVLNSIDSIYKTKSGHGEIRRINVNVAPLELHQFQELKAAGIGTYQLFQETYHRETYRKMHIRGPKSDYQWRLEGMDRAMEAGIDDVGVGVLFGLQDWRFEVLALMQHIGHLEKKFGVGPHTISVPRLEPATGSLVAGNPPVAVSDLDFKKIVAILRLAVPYTGIIMSTRESPLMRRETLALGVSQISAGSRTSPGGYCNDEGESGQFSLGDHRSLNEVINDVMEMGYIPSFCTGCYRLGRTGLDFMDMAKPGLIKLHCQPNALLTLKEYLIDFADEETALLGNKLIERECKRIPDKKRKRATAKNLKKIEDGSRDLYF